jgi:hypothetical protein
VAAEERLEAEPEFPPAAVDPQAQLTDGVEARRAEEQDTLLGVSKMDTLFRPLISNE